MVVGWIDQETEPSGMLYAKNQFEPKINSWTKNQNMLRATGTQNKQESYFQVMWTQPTTDKKKHWSSLPIGQGNYSAQYNKYKYMFREYQHTQVNIKGKINIRANIVGDFSTLLSQINKIMDLDQTFGQVDLVSSECSTQ